MLPIVEFMQKAAALEPGESLEVREYEWADIVMDSLAEFRKAGFVDVRIRDVTNAFESWVAANHLEATATPLPLVNDVVFRLCLDGEHG